MTIDHRFSLRSRLLAVVSILAVVLLGVAISAGFAFSSLNHTVDERVDTIYPAASTISHLRSSTLDLETSERGYVITHDPDFLEPYDQGGPEIESALLLLSDFAGSIPGLQGQIDVLTDDLDRWRNEAAAPEIDAVRTGDTGRGAALVESGTGQGLFDRVRGDLDGLQRLVDDATNANRVRSRSEQQILRNVLVAGLVTVLVLVVALAILLTRWVTRPTDRLVASVGVVADGNFREAIDVRGPPEFVAIGAAVDRMRQRILSELDQVERYGEALDQTGPVVQRLRSELEAGRLDPRDGVDADGRVLAAEGLLAGDFYDLVEMPGVASPS